jgi:hypothetical protein
MIIELKRQSAYQPPEQVLIITEVEAPSMCPEFDPNPDQSYSIFYIVNLAEGTNKKISLADARKIYNSDIGRSLCRHDRINFWRSLKQDSTGDL